MFVKEISSTLDSDTRTARVPISGVTCQCLDHMPKVAFLLCNLFHITLHVPVKTRNLTQILVRTAQDGLTFRARHRSINAKGVISFKTTAGHGAEVFFAPVDQTFVSQGLPAISMTLVIGVNFFAEIFSG